MFSAALTNTSAYTAAFWGFHILSGALTLWMSAELPLCTNDPCVVLSLRSSGIVALFACAANATERVTTALASPS